MKMREAEEAVMMIVVISPVGRGRRIFDRFDLSSSSMLTTSKSGATQRTLDHIKANPYHHHENTRTQISKGQSTATIQKSKPP